MIGKNMIDLKDADGKIFVKERMVLAKIKGTFWSGSEKHVLRKAGRYSRVRRRLPLRLCEKSNPIWQ